MTDGAIISDCGGYRYELWRHIAATGMLYAFFGVNGSTATAVANDQTVKKWIGFTRTWGGRGFLVGNLSPVRATDVRELRAAVVPADVRCRNEYHLASIMARADILVPCWGSRDKMPRHLHAEADALRDALLASGKPVYHLGLTKSGDPCHPQMLGYSTPLTLWEST